MSGDLRERVAAGYGEERFTVPLAAITRRAAWLRLRNRLVVLVTGAILASAGTVMALRAPTAPPVVAPSLGAPLLAPALEAACQRLWTQVSSSSAELRPAERTAQPPRLLLRRVAESRGISLHFNGRLGFECVIDGTRQAVGGIVKPPREGPNGTEIVYTGSGKAEPGYVWGWAPRGTSTMEVYGEDGRATGEVLNDGMFAFWLPFGSMERTWFRSSAPLGLLYSAQIGQIPLPEMTTASLDAFCRSALRERITLDERYEAHFFIPTGPQSAVVHFASATSLVQCQVAPTLSYTQVSNGGDLELLQSVQGDRCIGFGRAPAGTLSGTVHLGEASQSVTAEVSGGYYSWNVAASDVSCEAIKMDMVTAPASG